MSEKIVRGLTWFGVDGGDFAGCSKNTDSGVPRAQSVSSAVKLGPQALELEPLTVQLSASTYLSTYLCLVCVTLKEATGRNTPERERSKQHHNNKQHSTTQTIRKKRRTTRQNATTRAVHTGTLQGISDGHLAWALACLKNELWTPVVQVVSNGVVVAWPTSNPPFHKSNFRSQYRQDD